MAKITIDGRKYEVIETLPFHGVGLPAKVVKDPTIGTGERVAVKQGGVWSFYGTKDRSMVYIVNRKL